MSAPPLARAVRRAAPCAPKGNPSATPADLANLIVVALASRPMTAGELSWLVLPPGLRARERDGILADLLAEGTITAVVRPHTQGAHRVPLAFFQLAASGRQGGGR